MPNKRKTLKELRRYVLLLLGALFTSIGLEIFLIPNNIIDGGVIGISILTGYVFKIPIALLIFLFNLPFLYLGYKQIGKSFVLSTLFSVTMLSLGVWYFGMIEPLTRDPLLAAVFGGIVNGIGVGLIIRYGGSLDGSEIVAILIEEKTPFTIGQIIMFINVFILSSAAFVFGWDRAFFSMIAYYIAHKVIDIIIEGLDDSKAVMIFSDKHQEIASALKTRLGRSITYIKGIGGYSGENQRIIYSVVTRLEISKVKSIINDCDSKAFVSIFDVHEVMGGRVKKSAIH